MRRRFRSRADRAAGPSRHVLVIEDDAETARSVVAVLRESGHQVAVAFDGPSGLRKAREFLPDLVLCDIGLPGPMNGHDVGRELRNDPELRDACLVAVTGRVRSEDREAAREAGFDIHMPKPLSAVDLDSLVAGLPTR